MPPPPRYFLLWLAVCALALSPVNFLSSGQPNETLLDRPDAPVVEVVDQAQGEANFYSEHPFLLPAGKAVVEGQLLFDPPETQDNPPFECNGIFTSLGCTGYIDAGIQEIQARACYAVDNNSACTADVSAYSRSTFFSLADGQLSPVIAGSYADGVIIDHVTSSSGAIKTFTLDSARTGTSNVTWDLFGDDKAPFSITSNGELSVRTGSALSKSQYIFEVLAIDTTHSDYVDSVVVVVNVAPPPPAPPAPAAQPSSKQEDESASPSASVLRPAFSTCLTSLPNSIMVNGVSGPHTNCTHLDAAGIGKQSIIESGFIDAVDVWGYLAGGVEVCFRASGSLIFLDAAHAPRSIAPIEAYSRAGMTCGFVERPGSLVLVPGPMPPPLPPPKQTLQNCAVSTTDVLNFRDGPAGSVMSQLPYAVTLTALSRTEDWFEVDYHGKSGWVSADYVTTEGSCG